jgi:Ca2+-binding RTX toxin-like protein
MAVTATYTPVSKLLSVFGDANSNNVTISRNAAGALLVNGGAVVIRGGTATVANTNLIQVFGQTGADILTLDESLGALPPAHLFGGTGNDTLIGGSGGDHLFGQNDNDTLLGKGGNDFLFGGAGHDTLTGGDADDQVYGESGNDRFIWNPGDDTDLYEGGAGNDTTEVNGGNGAEVFTLTANGARTRFDRIDPAPFSLDMGTMEQIVVNMNGGDDRFSATGNLAALIGVTVNGGAGNDTILGSNGADQLNGGEDQDFLDGQQGNDVAFLGAGNDVFQWDPGDGSDLVEGGEGVDTLLFNGSAGNEIFSVSANGARGIFTRNLGNIVMDVNDLETVHVNMLGGTDSFTVNNLAGTDIVKVEVDLAGTIGGTVGDAAADSVIANATNANDIIDVFGAGTSVAVLGLTARIDIANSEGANDSLVINGLGGNDGLTATTMPAGIIKLTLDGGAGDDTILGSQGADTLIGGDGSDFVFGDNGNDLALLGANDDVFQWDPGDGSDTIEGGTGSDLLLFFGSAASENIDIFANAGRVGFFRNVASVNMDLNDVESIEYRALGGSDNIVIGDLSGTDVKRIDVDLRGPEGGGDEAADSVTVNGTNGADTIYVFGDAGGVGVSGLTAAVNIFFQEQANDRLTVNGLGGDDVINAASLEVDGIQLTLNGGLGNDILIGSEGNDLFNGGDGTDTALMGAGDDVFVWNPGDDNDTLEGQDGFDTMLFNGAVVSEQINIFANGGRALFTRDIANVVMDLNDVEAIDFVARGGTDTITIGDLTGTDLTEINLDVSNGAGAGDGAADTIIINATNGDDVILVVGDDGGVQVLGLSAVINITGFEAGLDKLIINALDGDDVVEASGLDAGLVFEADGGEGNDILIGGERADTLYGGNGDDVLLGGNGIDLLFGGTGDNVVIQ